MKSLYKEYAIQKTIEWAKWRISETDQKILRRHAIQAVMETVTGTPTMVVITNKDMTRIANAIGGTYMATKGSGNLAEIVLP